MEQGAARRQRAAAGWSARGAPGPFAKRARAPHQRAAGAHHTRREGLTSPLAPSRRSIPLLGNKEKGTTAYPGPIKNTGAYACLNAVMHKNEIPL